MENKVIDPAFKDLLEKITTCIKLYNNPEKQHLFTFEGLPFFSKYFSNNTISVIKWINSDQFYEIDSKILKDNLKILTLIKKLDYQIYVINRELNKFASIINSLNIKNIKKADILRLNCEAFWKKIHTFLINIIHYQRFNIETQNSCTLEKNVSLFESIKFQNNVTQTLQDYTLALTVLKYHKISIILNRIYLKNTQAISMENMKKERN